MAPGSGRRYARWVPGRERERVIVHLDMDAFYAAVEVREDPSLVGKPLIIGHRGQRGVVSTCSYEARRFGVRSAMPSVTAERLCPQATWLPGRMELYGEVSQAVRRILEAWSPVVEPVSIDEAFLDLTRISSGLDDGAELARGIKQSIRSELRLSSSAGVAPNKFLAKVASDLEKPDGLVVISRAAVPERLHPLPVERLWGVGPKTAERLRSAAIVLVGDVLRAPVATLERAVGRDLAEHLRALARGEDEREVTAEHEAKSISEERTYAFDLRDPDEIDRALLERAEGVARALRRQRLTGRTVKLKVRAGDFTTWTRSLTLAQPTDLAAAIVAAAREMLATRIDLGRQGVRLLGVGMSGLAAAPGSPQGALFADGAGQRARRAAAAADLVRDRFGEDALRPARLVRGKKGSAPPTASSPPTVD